MREEPARSRSGAGKDPGPAVEDDPCEDFVVPDDLRW